MREADRSRTAAAHLPPAADIRATERYRETEAHFLAAFAPGFGRVTSVADLAVAPGGRLAACTGQGLDALEGPVNGRARLCVVDLEAGGLVEIAAAEGESRCPTWSPDGRRLAFLSDRGHAGRFTAFVAAADGSDVRPLADVPGAPDSIAWCPAGDDLLVVATEAPGDGAASGAEAAPAWLPDVQSWELPAGWRRLVVLPADGGPGRVVGPPGSTVWEAAWAGPRHAVAVVSDGPAEEAWYGAWLVLLDVASGAVRRLARPADQLGRPVATASGRTIAWIDAFCSDRGVLWGDPIVLDVASGHERRIDAGCDVARVAWSDETTLVAVGVRGLDTHVVAIDAATGAVTTVWTSADTLAPRQPELAALPGGGFLGVVEGWATPPALVAGRAGRLRTLAALRPGPPPPGRLERLEWAAPDGTRIEGLLLVPGGPRPHRLLVNVHGGPVTTVRSAWGMSSAHVPPMVERGLAVLFPMPRGSAGRGRAFARAVIGDMGGAEARDVLAGVDAVVAAGVADPDRLAVMGASHGGFMTGRLVALTDRFRAAVSVAPVSDWISHRLQSSIAAFDDRFMGAPPDAAPERWVAASPVARAHHVRTPTLVVGGGVDRITPPGQAVELHRALVLAGVPSALAVYPEEAHGVRSYPALVDYVARAVDWIERFVPA